MTTYNTGNPLGSTDPKDLYDNAQNLDEVINSTDLNWTDRLGVQRRTLAGAFDDFPNTAANRAAAEAAELGAQTAQGLAEDARDAAIVAQTAAELAEINAETAESNAELAAASANSAAVAALAASNTYADTAAGLAATVDGDVFLVTTANPQIFEVYDNQAGSSVLLGELNIADGRFFVVEDYPTDSLIYIADSSGQIVAEIDKDAGLILPDLTLSVQEEINDLKSRSFATADENLVVIVDSQENLLATFDSEANLFLAGMSVSVQEAMSNVTQTNTKYRLYTFRGNGADEILEIYEGSTPNVFDNNLNATYTGLPVGHTVRDPSVFYDPLTKIYWLAHTWIGFNVQSGYDSFDIANSKDGINFTFVATISTGFGAEAFRTWSPEWFVDTDGAVYITVHVNLNDTRDPSSVLSPSDPLLKPYLLKPKNISFTEFENLGLITGTAIPNNCIDTFMFRRNGIYFCALKNESTKDLSIAFSSNLQTGYDDFIDLSFLAPFVEGPSIVQLDNGDYRIYFDRYINSPSGLVYVDTSDLFQTFTAEQAVSSPLSTERHGTVMKIEV